MVVSYKNMLANTDFALVQAEHGAIRKISGILPNNPMFSLLVFVDDQYFSYCPDLLHTHRQ